MADALASGASGGNPVEVQVLSFICIAEEWCGDVKRHVPALAALERYDHVAVSYLYREDAPDVFIRYLTNGGEAIPKMIFISDQWVETGNWGPMPDACRALIAQGKAAGDVPAARKLVAAAYQADEQLATVFAELAAGITRAAATEVVA